VQDNRYNIIEVLKMNEMTVQVTLPSDLYAELGRTPLFRGRLKQKLQLDLAVGMFVSKEISLSRAAEYAGMALRDFIELLINFGVPVVDYTDDMLEDDLAFVKGL
jgi:predicted HTH domain antitoxin